MDEQTNPTEQPVETAAAPAPTPAPEPAAAPAPEPAPAPAPEPAAAPAPEPEPAAAPAPEPAPAPAPATAPAPAPEPAPASAPVVANGTVPNPANDFLGYCAWIEQNGSLAQKEILRVLSNYVVVMAPKKFISDEDGAKQNFSLFKAVENVLEKAPIDQFTGAFMTILAFYNEYDEAALGPAYVNRFAHTWPYSVNDLTKLQVLNNLFMITCNPAARSTSLKQVSLERTMDKGFSNEARQRVMNFYKQYM